MRRVAFFPARRWHWPGFSGSRAATVVIGGRNEAQLRDSLAAIDLELTADERQKLGCITELRLIYSYCSKRNGRGPAVAARISHVLRPIFRRPSLHAGSPDWSVGHGSGQVRHRHPHAIGTRRSLLNSESAGSMAPKFLTIDPDEGMKVLKGLASPVRTRILKLLHERGKMNINEISQELGLPQSSVATNVQVLERAGLIGTETVSAKKGQQKLCTARYDEILVRFDGGARQRDSGMVEVSMPVGLFTSAEVSAPCGLCSTTGVIGLLDVPDSFMDPGRVQAALAWFGRGHVEYKFPNNAKTPRFDGRCGRVLDGAVVRGTGDEPQLAFRHHLVGQRRPGRHVDVARRLR